MALNQIKISEMKPESGYAERLQEQTKAFTAQHRPELEENFAIFMLHLGKLVGAAICYGAALSNRPVELELEVGEKTERIR